MINKLPCYSARNAAVHKPPARRLGAKLIIGHIYAAVVRKVFYNLEIFFLHRLCKADCKTESVGERQLFLHGIVFVYIVAAVAVGEGFTD